jgi:hypothetical protein
MLHWLLLKDLRRARRNPLPWLVNLAVPLVITALIGLAFGGRSENPGLGRIRFALVDEDDSPLTRFLRGGLGQDKAGEYLEPVLLDRASALRQIQDNQLSALVVIPAGFTRNYLTTTNGVTLELVKNPAQSIHPAVIEELLGALVTGLDVLKRHLGSEFVDWQEVFDGHGDHRRVADLIVRAGDKIEAIRRYVVPPRITYQREAKSDPRTDGAPADGTHRPRGANPAFNLFAFLLPGMASMFLLFLGNTAMADFRRELQQRTLARLRTLRPGLLTFVTSKVVFSVVMLLISATIMLGGGGWIFRIDWRAPLAMMALTTGYCVFAAGFTALLGVVVINEERGDAFGNVAAMAVGLAGGGAFPAQQLPALLREHVSPWLPNYWFTETVHAVSLGSGEVAWAVVAIKTLALGLGLVVVAAWLLRRRLERRSQG